MQCSEEGTGRRANIILLRMPKSLGFTSVAFFICCISSPYLQYEVSWCHDRSQVQKHQHRIHTFCYHSIQTHLHLQHVSQKKKNLLNMKQCQFMNPDHRLQLQCGHDLQAGYCIFEELLQEDEVSLHPCRSHLVFHKKSTKKKRKIG